MSAIDRVLAGLRPARPGGSPAPREPRLKLAVLTCMDSRLDVYRLLGLQPGDANVVRNAGGRVNDDVLRSLEVSQSVLGTEEVMVIHHTGCGMLREGEDPRPALREAVAQLRGAERLPQRAAVRGFLYDLDHGRLDEVGGEQLGGP